MRLKRLDIVGFKSFLEKTVVRFDDGVTGVVGPNGCGKSNIVDAIRWVLGEQSPKHLRGSAMQDVIFNGSQSRAPVNMAEVTLTFVNNVPEEIPARYRSFAEIAVTRRLFRNGDSEYFINKSACRLMDITEVFLGTGVGTKAYSIIEQGRIGLIVSAKAEDRRALIEEAAGITRYKSKRRIAERKMEQTRTNLLRVGDLVTELGRRLDNLSRQAKKAEKYKQLKAELRQIELHVAAHRWLEISATSSWISSELASTRARAEALSSSIGSLEKDVRERRDRVSAEEARLAAIQAQAAEAEGQAKVHLERIAGLVRQRDTLDVRTEEARREVVSLEGRRTELSAELCRDEATLVAVDEELASGRTRLEQEVSSLKTAEENVGRLSGSIEAERRAMVAASSDLTKCESQIAALTRRGSDLQARKAEGGVEVEALQARLEALHSSRSDMEATLVATRQRHAELESERIATGEALACSKVALEEAEAGLSQVKQTLMEKRSRLQSLEEIQRSYEGYESGVKAVMLNKDRMTGIEPGSVLGLVADVVRTEPMYETALGAVLAERLQDVLVTDQSTGQEVLSWLSEQNEGRSAFVPLDDLRPGSSDGASARALLGLPGVRAAALDVAKADRNHDGLLRLLLGDILVVEDLGTAMTLWPNHEGLTFVTLNGEIVRPSGTMVGGSRDASGAGMLEARREIDELRSEIERLEMVLSEATEIHQRHKRQRDELEDQVASLSKQAHAEQINAVTQDKEVHRLSDETGHVSRRLEAVRIEEQKIDTALVETATEIEATRAAMSVATSDREAREARAQEIERELLDARVRVAELHDAVTGLRVSVAENIQRRDGLARQLERAKAGLNETSRRIAQLSKTIEGSGAEFEAIADQTIRDEEEAAKLMTQAETMRTSVARGRETAAAASAAVKLDESRLDEMRKELEIVSANASKLEIESRELALEVNHLAETVSERCATELFEAIHDWHLTPPPTDEDFDRLDVLRSKIERIGEVNLTAIREYEEIAERHGFLKSHKEDLESSLAQLETAISRIDKTSKKRFLETFARVDELFQQVFPRLFNGGKAGLSLSDPSDPLSSGVDIFAQPPGKKLQNVNLLSGGEKALTATSLIFAMFLVRPTPFCLLDEVDAPLDDQNVHRYNQLVREMSRRSQFILITHNKNTMETVDTLYGVTMEEPGVSKLVSVRLSGEGPTAAAA